MPLFTYQNLKQSQATFSNAMDQGFVKKANKNTNFDVFLSHSFQDKNLAIDVKNKLHDYNISVYIDWIDDPQLDRTDINRETAALLRTRMQQCKSLAFLDTEEGRLSNWTPWEVGFADAHKQRVFIIPVRKNEISYKNYLGQEFFSLYPFLDEEPNTRDHKKTLWINSSYQREHYDTLQHWLKHGEPFTNHNSYQNT